MRTQWALTRTADCATHGLRFMTFVVPCDGTAVTTSLFQLARVAAASLGDLRPAAHGAGVASTLFDAFEGAGPR